MDRARVQCELGSARVEVSGGTEGAEDLVAARDLARELGAKELEVVACCELTLLGDGDAYARDAVAALSELKSGDERSRLSGDPRWWGANCLLWKATRNREHLERAKELLDAGLARVPDEYHDSMLTNVRINREIMAAWRDEFGDDQPSTTAESETRPG